MQKIVDAAVSFPAIPFSAALVLVAGFWVFVLCKIPVRESHRQPPAGREVPDRHGLAVMRTASVVLLVSWAFSVAGSLFLHGQDLADSVRAVLAVFLLAASATLGLLATRLSARAWNRLRG